MKPVTLSGLMTFSARSLRHLPKSLNCLLARPSSPAGGAAAYGRPCHAASRAATHNIMVAKRRKQSTMMTRGDEHAC